MEALLLSAVIMSGVFIRWAIRNDAAEAHLLHKPGTCTECENLQ